MPALSSIYIILASLLFQMDRSMGYSRYTPGEPECGVSNVPLPRVVGGSRSALNQWPWMAAIFMRPFARKPFRHVSCGGVLISSRHILTAAHCATKGLSKKVLPPSHYLIYLGDINLNKNTPGADPHDFLVDMVVPHEWYNPDMKNMIYDIALLRLSQSVRYSQSILPICLPQPSMARESFYRSQPHIAGWGRLSYGGQRTSFLHHAQLQVISNRECSLILRTIMGVNITASQVCTGDVLNNKDNCQGDSGGPLMLPRANRWHVIGVVSIGWKCAVDGFPGVYTRVASHLDWVLTRAVGFVIS